MSDQRKRIVVIDDEPDLLDVMTLVLREYEVRTAGCGEEGLELIRRWTPDLVLLDSLMPGMSGVEMVRAVKGDVVLRHVPVIMVTARGTVSDRVEGLQAGADDYVVKPFATEELIARVQINLQRTERDLDANPLTRMPGNAAIQTELERLLELDAPFAVCYVDLDRFTPTASPAATKSSRTRRGSCATPCHPTASRTTWWATSAATTSSSSPGALGPRPSARRS